MVSFIVRRPFATGATIRTKKADTLSVQCATLIRQTNSRARKVLAHRCQGERVCVCVRIVAGDGQDNLPEMVVVLMIMDSEW